MECHICSLPHEFFFFFHLPCFNWKLPRPAVFGQEMLQSRVQPSNITFSILVKLHFEAAAAVKLFGAPHPRKMAAFLA